MVVFWRAVFSPQLRRSRREGCCCKFSSASQIERLVDALGWVKLARNKEWWGSLFPFGVGWSVLAKKDRKSNDKDRSIYNWSKKRITKSTIKKKQEILQVISKPLMLNISNSLMISVHFQVKCVPNESSLQDNIRGFRKEEKSKGNWWLQEPNITFNTDEGALTLTGLPIILSLLLG